MEKKYYKLKHIENKSEKKKSLSVPNLLHSLYLWQ